jgi:hypothetical protein
VTRIFISYRRSDTPDAVQYLYDRLTRYFGENNVFLDVDLIAGESFERIIDREIAKADVMLVLIGTDFLTSTQSRRVAYVGCTPERSIGGNGISGQPMTPQ